MDLLNWNTIQKGGFRSMQKAVTEIKKKIKGSKLLRPDAEMARYAADQDGVKIPVYYDGYHDPEKLHGLYLQSDILRIIVQAINNKLFRRGFEIIPKKGIETPNPQQKELLLKLLHKANDNDQSLKQVLKMFERDLDVQDDAFLICAKDYSFGMDGEIIHAEPKELIAASPAYMRLISDAEGRKGYNDEGERMFVDPTDRTKLIKEKQAREMGFVSNKGIKLLPALYRGERAAIYGSQDELSRYVYYIEDEVQHLSKYNPTLLYGYSNIHSVWLKVLTLIGQDRYFFLNYIRGRPPRGLLAIGTTNFEATRKAWEHLKAETMKDPHQINPLLLQNETGKTNVSFTEFLRTPEEMQLIPYRNETRRQIGALYGVMPLFSGDITQSGGLNNESMQVEVTNDAIQDGQELYNEKVLPFITKCFNITDWELQLREPEEDDETENAKKLGVKIENAQRMSQMGFAVTWDEANEEFNYSEEATQPTEGFAPNVPTAPIEQSPEIPKQIIDLSDFRKKNAILRKIEEYSQIEKADIEKEDKKIVWDLKKQVDPVFLATLAKQLHDKSYEGLTKATSDQINNIILDGVTKRSSLQDVINKIEKLGVKKTQAELIARTESSVLKNTVREFNFQQAENVEEMKFKWIGPRDKRTSDISKEIKRKSSKGMKLEKLKELVRKTSEKFGFKPDRDWFSHPNQRHTFTRKF